MREPAGIRILVWMCVLIAVNQLGFGSIIPALALYARSFDVSQSAIGLAIAIYGLARFLVAMPAGQLADRVGRGAHRLPADAELRVVPGRMRGVESRGRRQRRGAGGLRRRR